MGITNFCRFNSDSGESSDAVVTLGHLPKDLPDWWFGYPRKKKIAILPENPLIFFPKDSYLNQHGMLISPALRKDSFFDGQFVPTHAGVPWFYGIVYRTDCGLAHSIDAGKAPVDLSYHASRLPMKKHKLISMITEVDRFCETACWER